MKHFSTFAQKTVTFSATENSLWIQHTVTRQCTISIQPEHKTQGKPFCKHTTIIFSFLNSVNINCPLDCTLTAKEVHIYAACFIAVCGI